MSIVRRFCNRLRNFLTRRHDGARLREEMAAHLAMQTEENLRAGMSPAEARRQAHLKFGGTEAVRADYHAEHGLPFFEDLWRDVRYALRGLRNSPAFTLVAVGTLLLGIAANVVVFGLVNAILLRPLEVSDPSNLYQLRHQSWTSFKLLTTPYPVFEDYVRRNTAFRDFAGYYGYAHANFHPGGNTVLGTSGYAVTGNYFDFLGIRPQLGRFFHAADEHGPDSVPYLVLSDSLWRRAFHADPGVIGRTVRLYTQPYTVIGVAPPAFHGTERFVWPDYYISLLNYFDADYLHNRTSVAMAVLGRLRPGINPQQATENLDAVAAQLAREHPATDTNQPLRLVHPGIYGDTGDVVRGFLYGVGALALLVLLAACANLAGLFAARAADRHHELALRVALGASRGRLVRQLLTEALVVSLLGGGAGLLAAGLLLGGLSHYWIPPFLGGSPPSHLDLGADARVGLVALALTLLSGLGFGLIPAWQVGRSSPLQAMKGGPVDAPPGRGFALRDALLGAQIAVCTLLVTASLVAVRGMVRLLHTPLGFHPQGALLAEIDLGELPGGDVPLVEKHAMLDAVRGVPGVAAAGTLSKIPFTGGLRGVPVYLPGTTDFALKNAVLGPYVLTMSPGYLEAAGARLLGGRDVGWQDTVNTPFVAVVNATFAREMWGDAPALGQRFIVLNHLTEVVGIAEDGKYYEMSEAPQPVVYLPLGQDEGADTVFVVRSSRPPNELTPALSRALNTVEPNAPVSVRPWPEALAGALFAPRVATVAVGAMGGLAAMLAATGIFGLAAYNVSRRMKELGIRVALGARKVHVLRSAVGRPLTLLGVGSSAGLLLGLFADRLLSHLVYQANPQDPVVLGGAVLTMAGLGFAATALPALRALSVDPARLLRED